MSTGTPPRTADDPGLRLGAHRRHTPALIKARRAVGLSRLDLDTTRWLISTTLCLLLFVTMPVWPARGDSPPHDDDTSQAAHIPDMRIAVSGQHLKAPRKVERYTLRVQRGVATITAARQVPGPHGEEKRVGIVDDDALRAAWASLRACELFALRAAPGIARPQRLWTFDVRRGDERPRQWRVADPERQPDRRHQACLDALQKLALEQLGPIPEREPFKPGEAVGFLHIDSVPTARVWVDGVDTGRDVPLRRIPLRPGEHKVTFVAPEMGLERSYTVKIMADITTNLDVDLR